MAALTAAITISSASCIIGQTILAIVTVSNSNAYPVNIIEIKPTCIFTGNTSPKDGSSFYASPVLLSQGASPTVPASGSKEFYFHLSPYEPSINYDHTQGTYDVSCKIQSDNNDNISPTAATLQVLVIPKEASTP